MEDVLSVFNVHVFGDVVTYSKTISSARVRIFYKGHNRNATYITEEFAEKLISSLPYTPVKGIYEIEDKDFSDHGKSRTQGRIYGVVPENPNFQWERHLDEDGVEREYACADVLLFTGLYPEASEIFGKSQSMELYPQSIEGEWQVFENKRVYVYTDGCFLGLQALGDDTEPCFEGSEFFSLFTNLKEILDRIKGGKRMVKFKLSDSTKHDLIFQAINPNFSEAGGWMLEYGICEVYDDFTLCYDYEKEEYCRWYYQKDDSNDTITLGEREVRFIVDVSESEHAALSLLREANNGTFENINDTFMTLNSELTQAKEALEAKVEEYSVHESNLAEKDALVSSLQADLEAQKEVYNTLQETLDAAIAERDNVAKEAQEFKLAVELEKKEAVKSRFESILSSEILTSYTVEVLNNITVEELNKELAVKAFESNPHVFKQADPQLIPTNSGDNLTGAAKILMKHKKK